MTQVAIIYHSGYGHTRRMAQAVADGVAQAAEVHAIEVDAQGNAPDAAWDTLATADAIVFGSPTYMGTVSWPFRKFADASSKPWFGQKWKDRLAAGFTNSASMNGDKQSTLHYLMTLAMQYSMPWVATGLMPSNGKAATRNDINYVASFAGAMASTPSDASVDEMLDGDLEMARLFGVRVAEQVLRLAAR